MKPNELINQLIAKLNEPIPQSVNVVIMPHFCIDNFIQTQNTKETFFEKLETCINQGGGNIVFQQHLIRGGKAANCASALAALGIKTYLIAKTNPFGYKFLEQDFQGKNADLSHIKTDGRLGFTSAIELKGVNVMLSDPGSVEQFGPDCLDKDDYELIKRATLVGISDWGMNQKGTDLTKYVFDFAHQYGCKTFFDPGDPTPKGVNEKMEVQRIREELLKGGLVDLFSVNDDEVKRYGQNTDFDIAVDFLKNLTSVELHTEKFTQRFQKNTISEKVPTFMVNPLRLTGAGDAWNAGTIYGKVLNYPDELSLLLGNAVAGFYISNPTGIHGTRNMIIDFLKSAKQNITL